MPTNTDYFSKLLKTLEERYEKVKNCGGCARRREAIKKRIDNIKDKLGMSD